MQRTDTTPSHHAPPTTHRASRVAALILVLAVGSAGAYIAYDQYRLWRLAGTVRRSFAAHRYDEAREPLQRWLRQRPRSAEAQYYRAWLALIVEQPGEAAKAIEQATKLGLDPASIRPLTGIFQARAGQLHEAEPLLREAFEQKSEPRIQVAKELARIYL